MSERMKSNLICAFNYVLEEARESDWDGIIACHQGKLSCSTWNYQRSTIGAYFLKPKELKKDDITATVSELVFKGVFSCKTVLWLSYYTQVY